MFKSLFPATAEIMERRLRRPSMLVSARVLAALKQASGTVLGARR